MRRAFLISFATLFFLTACNSATKPNASNFQKAINQYLTKHGKVCSIVNQPFPIDVTESQEKMQSNTAPQMAVLEQAGLVHGTNMTVVVHGMLDALRGPTAPQPVRRYELTDEGKKYFQQILGALGKTTGFCYGDKTVDSIVRWDNPETTGGASHTEVVYTYKIPDLASWAERPDVQREFGDIRTTVNGISKSNETAELELTNQGWEVPEQ